MPPRRGQTNQIERVLQDLLDRLEKLEKAVSVRALPSGYVWNETPDGLVIENEVTGDRSGVIVL